MPRPAPSDPALAPTSPRALRLLLAVLYVHGRDGSAWLRDVGVDFAALTDPATRMTAAEVVRAWDLAAAYAAMPDLGLRAAALVDMRLVPATGHDDDLLMLRAAAAAATVGEALRAYVRATRVVAAPVRYELVHQGSAAGFRVTPAAQTRLLAFHTFYPALFLGALRESTGRRLVPSALRLACAPPADPAPIVAMFGVTPEYGSETCLMFSAADLAVPLLTASDARARLIDDVVTTRLQQVGVGELAQRVHAVVEARLSVGSPSTEAVARELGMSVRTLSRRLEDDGTSFRRIVDGVRAAVAQRLLDEGVVVAAEVARRVGFADERSLRRALRRWREADEDGRLGPEDGRAGP